MHREMIRDQKRKKAKRKRFARQLLIHGDDLKRFAQTVQLQLWTATKEPKPPLLDDDNN